MLVLEKITYLILFMIFLLGLSYQGEVAGFSLVDIFNLLVGLLILIQGGLGLKNSKKLSLIQVLLGLVVLLSLGIKNI